MAKKRTPADVFFPMVKLAADKGEDCGWVSNELSLIGYEVTANSIYQRIRQTNTKLEDSGRDPVIPELKEDNSSSGTKGKKLDLDALEGFFTTQIPEHDPTKVYPKDTAVEK